MVNFQPLYTTARVVGAIYKVASTTLLLIYLAKRVHDGRKFSRSGSRSAAIRDYTRG